MVKEFTCIPCNLEVQFNSTATGQLQEMTTDRQDKEVMQGYEKLAASKAIDQISNQISKFLEGVRIQVEQQGPRLSHGDQPGVSGEIASSFDDQIHDGHRKSDDIILNAERFKASVNPPPGNQRFGMGEFEGALKGNPGIGLDQVQEVDHTLDVDDQFFHVTCHIDAAMQGKIS